MGQEQQYPFRKPVPLPHTKLTKDENALLFLLLILSMAVCQNQNDMKTSTYKVKNAALPMLHITCFDSSEQYPNDCYTINTTI